VEVSGALLCFSLLRRSICNGHRASELLVIKKLQIKEVSKKSLFNATAIS
jgi:hypothetical protein